MQGHYGTRFLNMWKTGQTLADGTDVGVKNAMACWAEKLSGFAEQPERIKRVLDTLPAEPPSLPQFVDLCRAVRVDGGVQSLPYTPTAEDRQRQREAASAVAGALKSKGQDGIDVHWATHPRSEMHLRFIIYAAKKDARFQVCIADMVADGVVSETGKLLKVYRDSAFQLVAA